MIKTLTKFILCGMVVMVGLFAVPQDVNSDERESSGTMQRPVLFCDPPDTVEKTYEKPRMYPVDMFHADIAPSLCWTPVLDNRFYRYRLEIVYNRDNVASESLFAQIDDCRLTDTLMLFDTCLAITEPLAEDTIWYRVRWINRDGVYSDPSDTVYSIRDVTRPVWISLTVANVTPHPGGRAEAKIEYNCTEKYPAQLRLSENRRTDSLGYLSDAQTFEISEETGSVVYSCSYDEERKFVYGQIIDWAGNASDSLMTVDFIVVTGAHNYPNPFNPGSEKTTIVYNTPADKANREVKIYIYDLFGNLVRKIMASNTESGVHQEQWDGKNGVGNVVADGGYICVIKAGDDVISRHKIAVAK